MIDTKSVGSTRTCYSYGFWINKSIEKEEYMAGIPSVPAHEIYQDVGCSGYTRVAHVDSKLVILIPLKFYPERYRSEEFFKKWQSEIALMGGTVEYKGIVPYFLPAFKGDKAVKHHFENIVQIHKTYGAEDITDVKNEWVLWEIPAYKLVGVATTYHSFCLLRYAWSRHFTRVMDLYFEIKRKLCKTKPEPIEVLQLALYSFDNKNCGLPQEHAYNMRYCQTYCHHASAPYTGVYPIQKLECLKKRMEASDGLNAIFSPQAERLTAITYNEVLELIKNGKYKKAYELIRKK